MSEGPPLLEVRGLRTWFRAGRGWAGPSRWVRAVDGVDLDLREGEVLGLVGESGSGKSTLARSILRLLEPTEGTVRFEGRDVLDLTRGELRALRRRMQIVFQDPYASLSPRMRVGGIVAEPLRLHRIVPRADEERAVAELLGQVGLEPYLSRRFPHELSGGQRQRVAIARAIAVAPRMLVADEPVSALDVSIRAQTLEILRDLRARSGIAMLLISHDLAVVEQMCDRVAVMYAGRIVEQGDTPAVIGRALHPYTQRLVASVPGADPGWKWPTPAEGGAGHGRGWPTPAEGGAGPEGARRASVRRGADMAPTETGCAYAPRCPEAEEVCLRREPVLEPKVDRHLVACHVRAAAADTPPGDPK